MFVVPAGDWSNASNWAKINDPSMNGVPSAGDEARFTDSATVNLGGSQSAFLVYFHFGDSTLSSGNLQVAGFNHFQVGAGGSATLQLSGAHLNPNGTIVGVGGGDGTLTVNGGSTVTDSNHVTVGYTGTGFMEILDGGTVNSSGPVFLGGFATGEGFVMISGAGSKLNAGAEHLTVGNEGSGFLSVESGGVVSAPNFILAGHDTGEGEAVFNGAGTRLDITDALEVGRWNYGSMQVMDGASASAKNLEVATSGEAQGFLTILGGGKMTIEEAAHVAREEDTVGDITVAGGGADFQIGAELVVGAHGMGTMRVERGATATAQRLIVSEAGTGSNSPNGTVTVTIGGRLDVSQTVTLGEHSGAFGALQLENSGRLQAGGNVIVGHGGRGLLHLSDGASLELPAGLLLAETHGSHGELRVGGASDLITNGDFVIGVGGEAEVFIEGASTVSSSSPLLGELENSMGTATVSGAGSTWSVETINIGDGGRGQVNVENGGRLIVSGPEIALGESATGQGILTIGGGGSMLAFTGDIIAGVAGSGVFAVQAGAAYRANNITLGEESAADGTLNVAGASLEVAFDLIAGANGGGNINVTTGGSLITFGEATLGENVGSAAQATVGTGSHWQAREIVVGASGVANLHVQTAGQLTVSEAIGVAERAGSLGILRIDGAMARAHTEALHAGGLEDDPENSGGTATVSVLNGGRLFVSETLATWEHATVDTTGGAIIVGDDTPAPGNGTLQVNAHGILDGSGKIVGDVVNAAGHVEPGNSPGTLTIDGDYTQGASGTLVIELASPTVFDKLDVNGDATWGGTLAVELATGFAPTAGLSFDILDFESSHDTFEHLELPTLVGALHWDTSQLYNLGVLSVVQAATIAGDYNQNGVVDAADYAVWRKTGGSQGGYNTWRANFGRTAQAASAGLPDGIAAPEPAALVLIFMALLCMAVPRRPSASQCETLIGPCR